jgi:DMSO/TMAO reductase YedYZ molybdopterin-dependent catalytic subunit
MQRWFLPTFLIIAVMFIASCSGHSIASFPTTSQKANDVFPVGNSNKTPSVRTTNTLFPIEAYQLPITAVEDLGVTGITPEVDIESYHLTIDGMVESPLSLSYSDVMEYPAVSQVVILICPDAFVDNAEWTGVPVSTLLNEVGVKPEANKVAFYSIDGYQRTLPIKDVLKDGVFLAYKVNGQILPLEHGYPFRLVVKDMNGDNWIKWVDHIEVIYIDPWSFESQ